ncbi:MAG: hypothetical protein IJQ63_03720 [Synergistaceae bacterium]|nr:hypothetical protein [Synergistaceae bacterium]
MSKILVKNLNPEDKELLEYAKDDPLIRAAIRRGVTNFIMLDELPQEAD